MLSVKINLQANKNYKKCLNLAKVIVKKKKKKVQLSELKKLSNENELGFETFWNFERFIIICKIWGSYNFPKAKQ